MEHSRKTKIEYIKDNLSYVDDDDLLNLYDKIVVNTNDKLENEKLNRKEKMTYIINNLGYVDDDNIDCFVGIISHNLTSDEEEEDIYATFCNNCTTKSNKHIRTSALYEGFKIWFCENNPETKIPSNREFTMNIKNHLTIEKIRDANSVTNGIKKLGLVNQYAIKNNIVIDNADNANNDNNNIVIDNVDNDDDSDDDDNDDANDIIIKQPHPKPNYHFIYVLHVSQFKNRNELTYKIGRIGNIFNRFSQYQKHSTLLYLRRVIECIQVENEIRDLFNKNYTLMYGREYFSGDIDKMVTDIDNVIDSKDQPPANDIMDKIKLKYKNHLKFAIINNNDVNGNKIPIVVKKSVNKKKPVKSGIIKVCKA